MLAVLAGGLAVPEPGWAGTPPRADLPRVQIWSDPVDGLAIGGFDPLAYRFYAEPREGRSGLELSWGGAVWRFLNPGNLAAFARDPDAYMPRYGGYDVTALAANNAVQGHPGIWAIHENRLLLFANAVNRRLWEEDKAGTMARAALAWPEMSRRIPPFVPPAGKLSIPVSDDPAYALKDMPGSRPQAMKPELARPSGILP